MAYIRDLKVPTLVIAGYWNQAILNEPAWIAQHLLDKQKGDEVEVRIIVVGDAIAPQKQIMFFEGFGLCCQNARLEFYIVDLTDVEPIYRVVKALGGKLPHTPVEGVGVNFQFTATSGIAGIVPYLETRETFDAVGRTLRADRAETILIPLENSPHSEGFDADETMLRLERKTDFNTMSFDFNYHQKLQSTVALAGWASAAPIRHWERQALALMRDCYSLDNFEPQYF